MFTKYICILDYKGELAIPGSSVVQRHKEYSENLSKKTNGYYKFLIISKSKKNQPNHHEVINEFEHVVVRGNFLKYLKEIRKVLQSKQHCKLGFIASNPWDSFLFIQFVRLFSSRDFSIQIQIHADIFDISWEKAQLRNRVKKRLQKYTLPKAKNLRIVDVNAAVKLSKFYGIEKTRIYFAPIPLNLKLENINTYLTDRPKSIGILSRLQKERNLEFTLEVLEKIHEYDEQIKIIIGGSGNQQNWFLEQIYKIFPREKVMYFGEVGSDQIEEYWSKVGAFLSLAKSESYGRSIRESLCHGIPVLCYKTAGAESMVNGNLEFPVILLESTADKFEIAEKAMQSLDMTTNANYLSFYKQISQGYMDKLIESWIMLLNEK